MRRCDCSLSLIENIYWGLSKRDDGGHYPEFFYLLDDSRIKKVIWKPTFSRTSEVLNMAKE